MARPPIRFRKPTDLNKALVVVAMILVFAIVPQGAFAQLPYTDSHNVTVTVATVNIVKASAATASLTIGAATVTAGVDLMGPVTNSATNLLWGFNSANRRISVTSDRATPKYILTVEAVAPSVGSAAGPVTLNTTGGNFVTGLGRSAGSCSIKYTFWALASAGFGNETHFVTFTVAVE